MKQKLTNLTNVAKEKAHAAWNALEESPVWVRTAVSMTVGIGITVGACGVGAWLYNTLMVMSPIAAILFSIAWIIYVVACVFWAAGITLTQRHEIASIKDAIRKPLGCLNIGMFGRWNYKK